MNVPPLAPGEVHVWSVDLGEAPPEREPEWTRVLSAEERERMGAFRTPELRARFLLRRAALRTLLGAYLGRPPHGIPIEAGPHGRPTLRGKESLSFNLSHSGSRALIAVAHSGPVGVDLERIDPDVEIRAITERFFAPSEREQIVQQRGDERVRTFYRIWTAKEALLKATGLGLSGGLDQAIVKVSGAEISLRSVPPGCPPASSWSMLQWETDCGFIATLAVAHPAPTLRRMIWEHEKALEETE